MGRHTDFIKENSARKHRTDPWQISGLGGSELSQSRPQVGLRNAIAGAAPASALKTLKCLSEGISVTNKKRKEFQHYPGKSFLFHVLVIFVPALQCTVNEV